MDLITMNMILGHLRSIMVARWALISVRVRNVIVMKEKDGE